jgi:hypothetical protein
VLALDRRVRDLEDIEDAHGDVIGQLGKDARHPGEADLPLLAQRQQSLDRPAGL